MARLLRDAGAASVLALAALAVALGTAATTAGSGHPNVATALWAICVAAAAFAVLSAGILLHDAWGRRLMFRANFKTAFALAQTPEGQAAAFNWCDLWLLNNDPDEDLIIVAMRAHALQLRWRWWPVARTPLSMTTWGEVPDVAPPSNGQPMRLLRQTPPTTFTLNMAMVGTNLEEGRALIVFEMDAVAKWRTIRRRSRTSVVSLQP